MQIVNHIIMQSGEARLDRKPHLKAEMVARMVIDGEYSIEQVVAHYELTTAEVYAALAYYYDNQAELDSAYERVLSEIHANAMWLEKFKQKLSSTGKRNTFLPD